MLPDVMIGRSFFLLKSLLQKMIPEPYFSGNRKFQGKLARVACEHANRIIQASDTILGVYPQEDPLVYNMENECVSLVGVITEKELLQFLQFTFPAFWHLDSDEETRLRFDEPQIETRWCGLLEVFSEFRGDYQKGVISTTASPSSSPSSQIPARGTEDEEDEMAEEWCGQGAGFMPSSFE